MSRKLQRSEEGLIIVGLASGGLYLAVELFRSQLYFVVNEPYYHILHSLLEVASILVSFSIFIVNWEASKQNRNSQTLVVAIGFLAVTVLDMLHLLSAGGMLGLLVAGGEGKAPQYAAVSRLWAVGVLLLAATVRPQNSGRLLGRRLLLVVNLLACSAAAVGVLSLQQWSLPSAITDLGFPRSRLLAEYAIIGMTALALAAHLRAYRSTKDDVLVLVIAALLVNLFGELATAFNGGEEDVYELVGHLYKVVAYYLIFRALLVSSVHRPYVQLTVAKDRLERTVAELDVRNRELDALDDVALALSSILKPEELLESAIDKVMKVMQAGGGGVFLLEEGSEELALTAWHGLTPSVVEECRTRTLPLLHNSVLSGTELGQRSFLDDPSIVRSLGGGIARVAPLRNCVCAPIVSKGAPLGSIAMVAQDGRSFLLRDADLLTAVGYQLGLAIENARLYEQTDERLREKVRELQRAERRSRFLSEVGALLVTSMDLGRMLELVARETAGMIGDWCAVYLVDDRDKLLRLEALFHVDEGELAAVRRVLERRTIRVGEGPIGQVAESAQPLLMIGAPRDKFAEIVRELAHSVEEIAILRDLLPASSIVAPLRARGRTVGVLAVAVTHSKHVFDESDLSLVVELGDRVGVGIENRQLFQENLAQRRHLETIISQMVDGVVIADGAGNILVANASAQGMLGERLDQLVGGWEETLEAVAGAEGTACGSGVPLVARALGGELVLGEELPGGGPSGERILSASASPIRDEPGEITGAVVVLRDVTAEREVERMKDEFVSTVSHELRTPITAVMGYTDLLLRGLRGPLAPKQAETLRSVRNAAQRLLSLINDLLDISRLEAGKQDLSLQPVELFESAASALSAVAVLAASKGIRLVHSIPRGLPRVLADEEQLQRILGNLLSNAIKFTPEGGRVTLSAVTGNGEVSRRRRAAVVDEEADFVTVMVSDTGIGIAQEQKGRIWEKFHQLDSSSRRLFGGTGLGLAITRGLVELHGGRVWVRSKGIPGKGSTFGFTLPTAKSDSLETMGNGDQPQRHKDTKKSQRETR